MTEMSGKESSFECSIKSLDCTSVGVLVITYGKSKRLDNVKNLISLFQDYPILVAVDGPTEEGTANEIKSFKHENIKFKFQERNLGSRLHCLEAISWVSNSYDFFLVVEDDIHFDKKVNIENFIPYLVKYRAFSISLYSGYHEHNAFRTVPLFNSWGWIGSSVEWFKFEKERDIMGISIDTNLAWYQERMWRSVLVRNKEKRPPHWDYLVQNYLFNNGMSVLCGPTIVSNRGFADATNTFTKPSGYIEKRLNWNANKDTVVEPECIAYTRVHCWKMCEFPYSVFTFFVRLRHRIVRRFLFGSYKQRGKSVR